MSKPLISIIVPVYNVEKYLKKCIESILSQTYQNIEIILVDDGSEDNSGAICDQYAAEDARIVVIHKKNGGLSTARNAGIDRSNGDFISFIDSDDYVSEDFCKILLQAILNENADMVICNFLSVDENYNLIQENNVNLPIKNSCVNHDEFMKGYCGEFGWYYVIACNKLYKKSLFDELRYPVGKQHEDAFLIHRLVYQCNKIACVSRPLYYYVQRKGSIMSKISVKNMDLGEALIDQYWFAKKNGYPMLKNYAVRRLSFEFEKWKELVADNKMAEQKYKELRKKTLFLLYEKSAWEGYTFKAKVYHKLQILCPRLAIVLRTLKHLSAVINMIKRQDI